MIRGLKPYDNCKASGLPWLGSIPAHWEVRRNGRLFVQRNETGFPDLPILEVSLKTGVRLRDFENSTRKQVMSDRKKYKRARQGDIAYNMMRMWQGAVGVAPVDGLVSPAYIVAQSLPETDSRYYEYLFRIGDYKNEVNKFSRGIVSDRNRLYWEDFKQMPSPFPPPDEQAAIVRFLDYVDRRVRRHIRAKRSQVSRLSEYIFTTVLRGDNVPNRQERRLWCDSIPEAWKVIQAKRLFIESKITNRPDEELLATTQDRGVLPKRMCEHRYVSPSKNLDSLRLVEPNDYVISLRSFQGGIEHSDYRGLVSPAYEVFRLRPEYRCPEYQYFYKYLFKAPQFVSLLATLITGIRDGKNIPYADFAHVELPVPPKEELNGIVSLCKTVEDYQNEAAREIKLWREFMTRLAIDVVTGQLDVREAVEKLPHDVDDDAVADVLIEDEEAPNDSEPEEVDV